MENNPFGTELFFLLRCGSVFIYVYNERSFVDLVTGIRGNGTKIWSRIFTACNELPCAFNIQVPLHTFWLNYLTRILSGLRNLNLIWSNTWYHFHSRVIKRLSHLKAGDHSAQPDSTHSAKGVCFQVGSIFFFGDLSLYNCQYPLIRKEQVLYHKRYSFLESIVVLIEFVKFCPSASHKVAWV